jgi:hypothetical protein
VGGRRAHGRRAAHPTARIGAREADANEQQRAPPRRAAPSGPAWSCTWSECRCCATLDRLSREGAAPAAPAPRAPRTRQHGTRRQQGGGGSRSSHGHSGARRGPRPLRPADQGAVLRPIRRAAVGGERGWTRARLQLAAATSLVSEAGREARSEAALGVASRARGHGWTRTRALFACVCRVLHVRCKN